MKPAILALALLAAAGAARALPVATLEVPNYDLYYVGDLDPAQGLTGVGNEIRLGLVLDEPGDYQVDVQLLFGQQWIVNGHLRANGLAAGQYGPWTLNEIRSGLEGEFRGSGDFNEDFIEEISGNSLPSGTYLVRAEIRHDGVATPFQVPFQITDPRRIDLQSPWDGAGLGVDEPSFSWSGRADNYRLRVAEYDPERHGSPQEALAGEPLWVWDPADGSGRASVVYGESGVARPLRPGRQYVWQVEAVLRTTSGERAFPSAVRVFHLAEGGGTPGPQQLDNLLGALTPSQLAGLADLLANYRLDGTILVDGQPVSQEEFRQLLGRIASGELNIASIRIE